MLSDRIVVCAADDTCVERAKQIAHHLSLPYKEQSENDPLVLMVDKQGAFLQRTTHPPINWRIDFSSRAYTHRYAQRTRKNDPLAKALGLHKKTDLKILDMSAGLGKDAHWIAHCGATVTLLERHPVLAFLLQEAVEALGEDPLRQRMTVIQTDAASFLETLAPGSFDVAYYDPMFLPRQKSALVKKDMQIMHALLGEDETSDILLKTLNKIPKLVVKRSKNDPRYEGGCALQVIDFKAGQVRYEVYSHLTKIS